MKALKEKRISLRSLWRRGLVILSLFALVFASCGESSGVDESGGPTIARIKVRDNPKNDQYFGMPVDLTGTTLEVWYTDGKKEIVTDTSKFTAYPRIVTGVYYDRENGPSYEGGFYGMDGCFITYKNFGDMNSGFPNFNDRDKVDSYASFSGVKVWGIWTTNTTEPNYGPIFESNVKDGLYDLGLHLTGYTKLKKDAYVDDDEFDLSGLVLEGDYFWYNAVTKTFERDRKELNLADTTWRILPSYELNADGSSKGYIYVTVGEDFYNYMRGAANNLFPGTLGAEAWWDRGVTTSLKLDTVYIVDKIALKTTPNLEPYFYWQKNTPTAWADRLGDDAKLVVSYTGGKPDREFYIRDLFYDWNKTKIWYNGSPGKGGAGYNYEDGPGRLDIAEEEIPNLTAIYRDFYIVPIQYPLTTKRNKDPGITLYYRGAETFIPVDVYTTLVSVSAVSKTGGDIIFRPGAVRDNDKDNGLPGSGGLAALLNVTATYQAYNNPSAQTTIPLIYKGDLAQQLRRNLKRYGNDGKYDWFDELDIGGDMVPVSTGGEYVPYYTFSKEDDDSSYKKVFDKWVTESQKWNAKDKGKESFIKAVTVGHNVEKGDPDAEATDLHEFELLPYLCYDPGNPLADADTGYVQAYHVFDYISGGEDAASNFQWNLKKRYDAGKQITYYRWVNRGLDPNDDITDIGFFSGVKAKAKTDKPSITWIVKE